MKKTLLLPLSALLLATASFGYDHTKAQQFNSFYSHLTQKVCANSKLFISADDVMKMYSKKKSFTLVDVRTHSEASIVALHANNTLQIPIDQLFRKENLDKLPTNKPLIIVCHSGTRALMAAVGLKQLGFKNAQVLKGGIVALAHSDTPKNAPLH